MDVKGGFNGWFVETRETTTGIRSFELCDSGVPFAAVQAKVLAPIETLHLIVQDTREVQLQDGGRGGRKVIGKLKGHSFLFQGEDGGFGLLWGIADYGDGRLLNLQVQGVKDDSASLLDDLEKGEIEMNEIETGIER